jgi:hypothetical protein
MSLGLWNHARGAGRRRGSRPGDGKVTNLESRARATTRGRAAAVTDARNILSDGEAGFLRPRLRETTMARWQTITT